MITQNELEEAGVETYLHETNHGDRWGARHRHERFAEVNSQRYRSPYEANKAALERFRKWEEEAKSDRLRGAKL